MDVTEIWPSSCDTFVALPPATGNGCVIFGKNSDRPKSEVQEVILVPGADHEAGSTLQCTYIAIDQIPHSYEVILSKPAWMWGAEMGANEHGVVVGNEAVWTKAGGDSDKEERLLGMDLVRLGLERGRTAKEALDVIGSLLEKYGQGGVCYEDPSKADIIYHNSFIIADGSEAWVLETAGPHWVAQKVTSGVRNISNLLSIETQIDAMSDGVKDFAKENGWWNPEDGDFNFAKAFQAQSPVGNYTGNESPGNRYSCGKELMEKLGEEGKFSVSSMFSVLRDETSGICRTGATGSVTTGSQVSVLYPAGGQVPSCHWFTATPNPACSVFKPFFFCAEAVIGSLTQSPDFGEDDPAKVQPRFQREVDRRHSLYKAHETIKPLPGDDVNHQVLNTLMGLEGQCVHEVEDLLNNFDQNRMEELKDLFQDIVESEYKFYK